MRPQWTERWNGDAAPSHAPIPPPHHPQYDLIEAVQQALNEDSGGIGDITTLSIVGAESRAVGTFLVKADGVLAGLAVADEVFRLVDPQLEVSWSGKDGDHVSTGTRFGVVTGRATSLLVAERVALNFVQRMSGIATATAVMSQAVKGSKAKIIETRKTVPGLRVLDKWAVLMGGGANHRMGLYDMVMIKDNHVTEAGGITAAVARCQDYLAQKGMDVPMEVETRSLEEVRELMHLVDGGKAAKVTRIMLDNMAQLNPACPGGVDVGVLEEAVAIVGGRLDTEASGNVTLSSVARIASTGVTFISCGALTHSVMALDISLKIALA